jgi:hypothetical protein
MAIDIGSGATSRLNADINNETKIDGVNAANATGVLTSFETYFSVNAANVKLGTFSGSSSNWSMRDFISPGNVSGGSKQTITGYDPCDCVTDDLLGMWCTAGAIYRNNSKDSYYRSEDDFHSESHSYSPGYSPAIYATGISAAVDTTQAATGITENTCTGNGNITDTGGSGSDVTRRGFCYKVGTSGDPTTVDSVAYDDGTFGTGAYTKAITGLDHVTAYRVRAYCVNVYGTFYGDTVQVATTGAPTMTKDYLEYHRGRNRFRTRGVSLGIDK